MEFTYDNQYYNEGIGGFHRASIPYIHYYFEQTKLKNKTEKILDFGCGNGFHGAYLKSKCTELHGVDFSNAIQTSPSKVSYDQIFRYDLGMDTQLEQSKYDLLFSIEVIEHVKDYRKFLTNAYSCLKPGGVLFLTTTTYTCYLFVLMIIYRRKISLNVLYDFVRGWFGSEFHRTRFTLNLWEFTTGHYHGFSKRQLINGSKEAGFRIKKITYLPIQDVVPVYYLKQKKHGRFSFAINLLSPILISIGNLINFICAKTRLYTPNVLIIAEK